MWYLHFGLDTCHVNTTIGISFLPSKTYHLKTFISYFQHLNELADVAIDYNGNMNIWLTSSDVFYCPNDTVVFLMYRLVGFSRYLNSMIHEI